MRSEILDTATIYEINGVRQTGALKINFKSHPRFLSFVKLCINGQEYSLGSDDLIRAIERVACRTPGQDDPTFESPASLINHFAESINAPKASQNERITLDPDAPASEFDGRP